MILFIMGLLLWAFTVFSSLPTSPTTHFIHEKARPKNFERLLIPAINVNAKIQHVGVNTQQEMEVPNNNADVGWYKLGPRPGDKGSSVISGHFDGENGELGVFGNLHKLKVGDKLYIKYSDGSSILFKVREKRIYNPGYANEVFKPNDKSHLNVITCDGTWDGKTKSYNKRLVVFTDIVN